MFVCNDDTCRGSSDCGSCRSDGSAGGCSYRSQSTATGFIPQSTAGTATGTKNVVVRAAVTRPKCDRCSSHTVSEEEKRCTKKLLDLVDSLRLRCPECNYCEGKCEGCASTRISREISKEKLYEIAHNFFDKNDNLIYLAIALGLVVLYLAWRLFRCVVCRRCVTPCRQAPRRACRRPSY